MDSDEMKNKSNMLAFCMVALCMFAAAMGACSGSRKDKMLRFFFDEPPEKTEAPAEVKASPRTDPSAAPRIYDKAKYVKHPPFAEGDCGVCHALGSSQSFTKAAQAAGSVSSGEKSFGRRLILPVEEICFECHDDKSEESLEANAELIHGPTAAGECTICHDPHRSVYKNLLRMSDPIEKLCFMCHDPEDILAAGPHADLEGEACTECHDPHAGGEFLLK